MIGVWGEESRDPVIRWVDVGSKSLIESLIESGRREVIGAPGKGA